MTMDDNRYTSGLVFMAERSCDTLELSASMQRVLEANGHRICGVQVLSERHVQVTSDILTLELSVPEGANAKSDEPVSPETHSCQSILNHAALVIEITLTQTTDTGTPGKRNSQATLASLTCQMAAWLEPDYVHWLNEGTLLDTKDFVKAVARVMPRRVKRKPQPAVARPARPVQTEQLAIVQPQPLAQPAMAVEAPVRPVLPKRSADRPQTPRAVNRFPDVETTSQKLDNEYDRLSRLAIEKKEAEMHELSELRTTLYDDSDDEALEEMGIASPRNSVARMATWFVAITVGVFSLPMAAFLVVYNLFRGEDFRLAAQALSLTGLFSALNARGATADVVQYVTAIVT